MSNSDTPTIAVVIPTFREPEHIRRILDDLADQQARITVFVVNSNPGDKTSALVRSAGTSSDFREVCARQSDFWAGAVRKGMIAALERDEPLDAVLVLNSDIRLTNGFLAQVTRDLVREPAVRCYAATSDSRYVTSGVRMRSWVLSLTKHLPTGDLSNDGADYGVHMLAGRALLLPRAALASGALPNARLLPHYGADYEMTRRLGRRGFPLYVSTEATVFSDVSNTGRKASAKDLGFWGRLKLLWDKRSPSNLLYRSRFVVSCYPAYALIPGLISVILKTTFEVLLGRVIYRLVARHHLYD